MTRLKHTSEACRDRTRCRKRECSCECHQLLFGGKRLNRGKEDYTRILHRLQERSLRRLARWAATNTDDDEHLLGQSEDTEHEVEERLHIVLHDYDLD